MRRVPYLILILIGALSVPAALAEDRLGLQVIADGIVTRAQRPEGSYPSSDVRLNGQAALLASYRLTSNLFAFYEGRINHLEGLNHHDPPLRDTTTIGVLQGYLPGPRTSSSCS